MHVCIIYAVHVNVHVRGVRVMRQYFSKKLAKEVNGYLNIDANFAAATTITSMLTYSYRLYIVTCYTNEHNAYLFHQKIMIQYTLHIHHTFTPRSIRYKGVTTVNHR